jgi:hypothetical protein
MDLVTVVVGQEFGDSCCLLLGSGDLAHSRDLSSLCYVL